MSRKERNDMFQRFGLVNDLLIEVYDRRLNWDEAHAALDLVMVTLPWKMRRLLLRTLILDRDMCTLVHSWRN